MKTLVYVSRKRSMMRLQMGAQEGIVKIIFFIRQGPHINGQGEATWEILERPDELIDAARKFAEGSAKEEFTSHGRGFCGEFVEVPNCPEMGTLRFATLSWSPRTSHWVEVVLRRTEVDKLANELDALTAPSPLTIADGLAKQWLEGPPKKRPPIEVELLKVLNGPHGSSFDADFRESIVAENLLTAEYCDAYVELPSGTLLKVRGGPWNFVARDVRVIPWWEAIEMMKKLSAPENTNALVRRSLRHTPTEDPESIFLQLDGEESDEDW